MEMVGSSSALDVASPSAEKQAKLARGLAIAAQFRKAFTQILSPSVAIRRANAEPALHKGVARVSSLSDEEIGVAITNLVNGLADALPFVEWREHCHWVVRYNVDRDAILVCVRHEE